MLSLLAICVSALVKCLFRSFAHFKIVTYLLFIESLTFFTYSEYRSLTRYMVSKYFLPFCGLSFHFPDVIICSTKPFYFYEVKFIYVFVLALVLLNLSLFLVFPTSKFTSTSLPNSTPCSDLFLLLLISAT